MDLKTIAGIFVIVTIFVPHCSGCFGGRIYTASDASYCRSNIEDCMWRACQQINQYTPPGCNDPRIREQVRQKLLSCYDLNECFRNPVTIGCTTTISDCPMLHMCRQGQCWPQKISNFYCQSNYDCRNSVYQCISGQCQIEPYGGNWPSSGGGGSSSGNSWPNRDSWSSWSGSGNSWPNRDSWSSWSGSSLSSWNSWPSSSSIDTFHYRVDPGFYDPTPIYINVVPAPHFSTSPSWPPSPTGTCRYSDDCSGDSMCRQNQCWPRVQFGKSCMNSWECQNNLYQCIERQCRIVGQVVHTSGKKK